LPLQLIRRAGDDLRHAEHILEPLAGVDPSHDVLGGVVQSGEEAVDVHSLCRYIVGIGGQEEEMDIIQAIYQFSDVFQVLQGGAAPISGYAVDNVKSGATGAGVDPSIAEVQIMLGIATVESDIGRRPADKLHHRLPGQLNDVVIDLGIGTPEVTEGVVGADLNPDLLENPHCSFVDMIDAFF
jgi:hypothetical protein